MSKDNEMWDFKEEVLSPDEIHELEIEEAMEQIQADPRECAEIMVNRKYRIENLEAQERRLIFQIEEMRKHKPWYIKYLEDKIKRLEAK